MASINELNEIASSTVSTGYIGFDELVKEQEYKVLKFGLYKSNSFGKERDCVRVFIDYRFLILPERFDSSLKKMMNMDTEHLYIVYHGREGKSQLKRIKLSFVEKNNVNTSASTSTSTNDKKKK